jgi:hypothetical protein
VRLWLGNPSASAQKYLDNNQTAVQVGQNVQVTLTGGSAPFTIPNVPLTPGAVNYLVATVADPYGNNESVPAQVGPITLSTQSATGIATVQVTSPAGPTTVSAPQSTITIAGTVTGPTNTEVLVRLWQGNPLAPAQKYLSNQTAVLVGNVLMMLGQGPIPFTLQNVPLAPGTTNYFVLTVADPFGNNESVPVQVGSITQSSQPSATTVALQVTTPPGPTTVNAPQTTFTIGGSVSGPSGSQVLVRLWQSSSASPTQKYLINQVPQQLGPTTPLTIIGGSVSFAIPNIPLIPGTTNYFVLTVSDQNGNNESIPVPVPAITQSVTQPVTTLGTVTGLQVDDLSFPVPGPSTPVEVYGSPITIVATVMAAAPGPSGITGIVAQVNLYQSSAYSPTTKYAVLGSSSVTLTPGVNAQSQPIFASLTLGQANYFVVTVSGSNFSNESSPVPVPPILLIGTVASPTVKTPRGPVRVRSEHYVITGESLPESLVQIWRVSEDQATPVGAALLAYDTTTYEIAVPLRRKRKNKFVVTAMVNGCESEDTPVPTITHIGDRHAEEVEETEEAEEAEEVEEAEEAEEAEEVERFEDESKKADGDEKRKERR